MTFELQAWDLNSHFAGKTSQGQGAGSIQRDLNQKAPGSRWAGCTLRPTQQPGNHRPTTEQESGNLSSILGSATNSLHDLEQIT